MALGEIPQSRPKVSKVVRVPASILSDADTVRALLIVLLLGSGGAALSACGVSFIPHNVADDPDHDLLVGAEDNCPNTPNSTQIDSDNDGFGNACDPTLDEDNGVFDAFGIQESVESGSGVAGEFEVEAGEDEVVFVIHGYDGFNRLFLPASLQVYAPTYGRFAEAIPAFHGVPLIVSLRPGDAEISLLPDSPNQAVIYACDGDGPLNPFDALGYGDMFGEDRIPEKCTEFTTLSGSGDWSRSIGLEIGGDQHLVMVGFKDDSAT